MGTPEFALGTLSRLVEGGYNVVAVVTQPDKPVGRHQDKLQASAVKQYALAHSIPVLQPVKMKDPDCEYRFSLIDLNRMRVYKRRLTIFECLNDTTRFSYLSEMYIYFIRCYLHAMGWEDKLLDKAIRIKRRHDRAYSRRKAFFKKNKHGMSTDSLVPVNKSMIFNKAVS